jgi:phosphoserine phosphatase RsbU/P
MPDLIIRPKDGPPYTVRLEKLRTTVGRSSRNDICISDPFASRFHIELRREGDDFVVGDSGSANGTLLNGKRMGGAVRLQPGDELRIGETSLTFHREGIASVATRGTALLWSDTISSAGPELTIGPTFVNEVTSGILSTMHSASTAGGASAAAREVSAAIMGRRDLLAVVSKVGVALLSDTSLDETLNLVVDLVFDAIPAERGFLFLGAGEDLTCKVARTRHGLNGLVSTADIQISRSIAKKVFEDRVSVLTSDAAHDPRFQGSNSIVLSAIRSVMAVPLTLADQTFGMIYVDNPYDSRFSEEDLQVITTIAGVASIKIENARLAEARLDRKRIEEELKVASEIQMRLQPSCPPPIPDYDLCAYSIQCREIGGDYYDFVERKRQGRVAVTLGDVSGKGIGAALMMSSLHAAVRAQTQTDRPIRTMMSNLNDYIVENSPENKFLTLFYGELDATTGDLFYANGGHNPAILARATGQVERLAATGLPIGILPNQTYAEDCVRLWPGDVLVVYSDGISESVNLAGDEFGDDRLIDVVAKNMSRSAGKIRDKIDEALSRFVGTAAPVDDMTLLILKRKATDLSTSDSSR